HAVAEEDHLASALPGVDERLGEGRHRRHIPGHPVATVDGPPLAAAVAGPLVVHHHHLVALGIEELDLLEEVAPGLLEPRRDDHHLAAGRCGGGPALPEDVPRLDGLTIDAAGGAHVALGHL